VSWSRTFLRRERERANCVSGENEGAVFNYFFETYGRACRATVLKKEKKGSAAATTRRPPLGAIAM